MYPYMQPIPFRSNPPIHGGDTRFLPFFGFPFLAGLAGGLLGGALAFGRPWGWGGWGGYYPPYPYPYSGYPATPYVY